jgi:hypothetical protein
LSGTVQSLLCPARLRARRWTAYASALPIRPAADG